MTPICSVIIPTRGRPDGLAKTIESIRSTSNVDDVEILIRFDDDDEETEELVKSEADEWKARYFSGPRGRGYADVPRFVDEVSLKAQGDWVTMVDDDVTLLGNGWDEQLKALPTTGVLAQPEFYWLGKSKYESGSCGPVGWFVPNGAWKALGEPNIGEPADQFMYDLCVKRSGWRIHLLKGVVYNHDWQRSPK